MSTHDSDEHTHEDDEDMSEHTNDDEDDEDDEDEDMSETSATDDDADDYAESTHAYAGEGAPAQRWGRTRAIHGARETFGESLSLSDDASASVFTPASPTDDAPLHNHAAPPDDLGDDGRALWIETLTTYVLRADEAALLAEMCRTVDTLAAMRAALADADVVVVGSKGQDRAHPLLMEIRGAQANLIRFKAELALPDEDGAAGATPASRKAVKAANARWRAQSPLLIDGAEVE